MRLFPQYNEGNSWIHRRDPRSKLLFLIVMAGVALVKGPLAAAAVLALLAVHGVSARLPPSDYKAAGIALAVTGVTLAVVQVIFHGLSTGLVMAGEAVLRLACFMYAFIQFVQWTHPADLELMGVKLGLPHRLAILPVLMVRFLPLMERELRCIYESQYARGERFDSAWQKAKSFLPVMMPLVFRSLKCGNEIALSMETKAFGYGARRTFMRDINFTITDFLWSVAVTGAGVLLLINL